jgi:hypothetical protein
MAYKFIRQIFIAKRRRKFCVRIADYDLNFHQTRAAFDAAERRRKLARQAVSGQRHSKFRPEGTMEFPIGNHHSNVSAVLSGRAIFCRDTRHCVSG